jgi:peptidoglycan hydrolase-like protein with peptidoglycan-binding domain
MGAWTQYYKEGVGYKLKPAAPDTATMTFYAVVAIKNELIYQNYNDSMDPSSGMFGHGATKSVKAFQTAMGLVVDGVVGPRTARTLFRQRMTLAENLQYIPNHYVYRIASLESSFDPGAIGTVDPLDHGLFQINLHYHPDVSEEQSATPSFSIPWSAKQLAAAYGSLGDWRAAVASWNVGYVAARKWMTAGFPDDGSTAAHYYDLVMSQPVV